MSLKSIALPSLMLAMTLSMASLAAGPDAATEPCYKAFEALVASKLKVAPKVNERALRDATPTWQWMYAQSSDAQYELVAVNDHTHEMLARARCTISAYGKAVRLEQLPVGAL
jgi:hypothetical protein